jgi:trans-aconitate 2-methyltransferase
VSGWDAATYDRVAAPQEAWARAILDRLDLRPGERVLDAGCGSGRVTELLLDRGAEVVAVDADAAMVAAARRRLGDRAAVLHQDLLELALDGPVDAVFSDAVFHWIADHRRLFARLHAALRPGGRLSAQCGGHGNIARVRALADAHVADPPRAWNYATAEQAAADLRAAGFTDVEAWLEPWPVTPPEPRAYLRAVVLRLYPEHVTDAVLAELGDEPVLDYVRLNLTARRPA